MPLIFPSFPFSWIRIPSLVLDNNLWTEFICVTSGPRQLRASVFPFSLSSPAEINLEVMYSRCMAGRGLPNLLLTLSEWEVNVCWVKPWQFTDLSVIAASVYYPSNLYNLSCLPMVLIYYYIYFFSFNGQPIKHQF